MANQDEKLKYSICVDSLALLSACELAGADIFWNLHDNNINYGKLIQLNLVAIAAKKLNSKTSEGEIIEVKPTENSVITAKKEIESIFKKIRADLNSNSKSVKLIIEQIDTTECNKIRVTIESAIKWADDILEIDISTHFPHASKESDESKFEWGPTKVKNNLEYIAVLFELLLENKKQPNARIENEAENLTPLLNQIVERCQNPKAKDKTRNIRILYKLASSIKKDRITSEN